MAKRRRGSETSFICRSLARSDVRDRPICYLLRHMTGFYLNAEKLKYPPTITADPLHNWRWQPLMTSGQLSIECWLLDGHAIWYVNSQTRNMPLLHSGLTYKQDFSDFARGCSCHPRHRSTILQIQCAYYVTPKIPLQRCQSHSRATGSSQHISKPHDALLGTYLQWAPAAIISGYPSRVRGRSTIRSHSISLISFPDMA